MTKLTSDEIQADETVDGEYGRIVELVELLHEDTVTDILTAACVMMIQAGKDPYTILDDGGIIEKAYIIKSLLVGRYI